MKKCLHSTTSNNDTNRNNSYISDLINTFSEEKFGYICFYRTYYWIPTFNLLCFRLFINMASNNL